MIIGVDFRATVGFVTDPNANYTFDDGSSNNYPTSFGGTNIGWESGIVAGSDRDRSNAVDVRVAGVVFKNAGTATYRIDLPSAGTYSIQFALGDASNSDVMKLELFDDVTSKLVVNGNTGGNERFWAANGTIYTSAALWAAANVVDGGGAAQVDIFFASTIARFTIGNNVNLSSIAHIFISGGGSPPAIDILMGQAIL